MEVIEEFVSNVLLVFYYQLTLSRSDFLKCHMHYPLMLYIKSVGVV